MLNPIYCLLVSVLVGLMEGRPVTMVDLTYTFDQDTPTLPAHVKFERRNPRTDTFNAIQYQTAELFSSEHSGTHMDAPYHFNKQHVSMEQLPLELLEGSAVVLDISAKVDVQNSPNAEVVLEDIQQWELRHGTIPNGSMVIMHSGWGQHVTNKTIFYGFNQEDPSRLKFPAFHGDACQFLVESRGVRFLGVDSPSPDNGNQPLFPCHQLMADNNGVIVENMANVGQLPSSGAYIKAYPMKIGGGSGAPVRVIASITDPNSQS